MLILAISTSSKICSVALLEDDKIINEKRKKLESLEHTMDSLKKKYGKNIGNLHSWLI